METLTPREKFNEAARRQRLRLARLEKDRLRKTPARKPDAELKRAYDAGYGSIAEVAKKFGVHVSGIQHATSEGRLPYVKISRTRYVKYTDYQKYLDVNQQRRIESAKKLGKENKHEGT